ncbi:MAG: polysaccharide deacetylase family protein [Bacteroidota bacterium]
MANYSRREIIKLMGVSATALTAQGLFSGLKINGNDKKHIITLSFDDGFKKSSILTAEIFEKHKLSACINVIATGHLSTFKIPDEYQVTEKGDFVLWNELQSRGHEIMPHGYKHANKTTMPLQEAKDLIKACLEYFTKNLKGFESSKAIFNMPYNASTPELEAWLMNEVLAFRTGGPGINSMPYKGQKKLTCSAFGPGSTEENLEKEINELLKLPSGWFIYNTHGLNGEGWGPMSSDFLDRLLKRLVAIDSVAVLPTGKVLSALS